MLTNYNQLLLLLLCLIYSIAVSLIPILSLLVAAVVSDMDSDCFKGFLCGTIPVNSNWLLLICPCLLLFKTIEKKFACEWRIIWSSESSFKPFLHQLTYQFQVIPTTTSTTSCWFFICSKAFTKNLLLPSFCIASDPSSLAVSV